MLVGADLPAGGNAVLQVDGRPVRRVLVGLGWRAPSGAPFEIDAQMALLGADGRVAAADDLVPLAALGTGGPSSAAGADGAADGSDDVEQVVVDLDAVPASVERLSFSAAIYAATPRRQSFRQVSGTFVRVADAETGHEIARHALALAGQETAVVLGELYRHRGGWKVRAVGQGYSGGLAAVARDVGAL